MKISIPDPCSEDWSKMTPTEQGAFCKKCALEVTDFTDKSALQIKEILTAKMQSNERVCGHIENRQLIEFNQEFIPWKSDQESFRAIWAFSLVAVFGLTLFSCQSTFSKEVVEKMRTSTEQMLEEEEKDTLDIAKLNDSIKGLNWSDTLDVTRADNPWGLPEIPDIVTGLPMIITNGGIGILPRLVVDICVTWNGNLATDGFVLIEPIVDEEKDKPLNHAELITNPISLPEVESAPPSPHPNEPNQNTQQRLNAKLEKGRPDFKAHISPIPIDKTSQLFVTIPAEGELKLSIWELPSVTNIHSETFDLVFGNHALDINFHDFPKGKYAIQLIWEDEKVVVPFEINSKSIS